VSYAFLLCLLVEKHPFDAYVVEIHTDTNVNPMDEKFAKVGTSRDYTQRQVHKHRI